MNDTLKWFKSVGVERFINDKYFSSIKCNDTKITSDHTKDTNSLAHINTLKELQEYVINLDHPLKKNATNTVFGTGNQESKIVFIGEAPGHDEDIEGIPFVGQSGQLLTNIMHSIGIEREKIYITNVVPWRPENNRTPSYDEIKFFKPILEKHIALINPKIIITLGATATKALLETNTGILSLRGKLLSKNINNKECIILPTYHPSYLLRLSSQKKTVWKDFLLLQSKIEELKISIV